MSKSSKSRQPTDPKIEERVARLVAEYELRLREELGKPPRTLHEIESDVEDFGNAIKESVTQEVIDKSAPQYPGSRASCLCGGMAKFGGWRERRVITLHGRLSFTRAYYYCAGCHTGFCPADQQLAIGSLECSRMVQAHIARVSAYLPFAQAAAELAASRGLALSPTTVQRYAKRVGCRIGDAWDVNQVQQLCGNLPVCSLLPERLSCSMDGVKVHTDGDWHDAKLGVVYRRGEEGQIEHSCFYGSFERSQQFGHRMRVLADINGGGACTEIQMVADGAEWIWKETLKWFPNCVETLDYYHLTEHIAAVATARFDKNNDQAGAWLAVQKKRLMLDQAGDVIQDIAAWQPRSRAKQELRRTTICYIRTHQDRIQYKTLRESGYDIGSGIMEAGCKAVVKSRLGGSGMRWSSAGASAVLHLSTHRHSTGRTDYLPFTAN